MTFFQQSSSSSSSFLMSFSKYKKKPICKFKTAVLVIGFLGFHRLGQSQWWVHSNSRVCLIPASRSSLMILTVRLAGFHFNTTVLMKTIARGEKGLSCSVVYLSWIRYFDPETHNRTGISFFSTINLAIFKFNLTFFQNNLEWYNVHAYCKFQK